MQSPFLAIGRGRGVRDEGSNRRGGLVASSRSCGCFYHGRGRWKRGRERRVGGRGRCSRARMRLRLKFARWYCHRSVSHKSGGASGTGGNLNPSPVLSSRRVSGCGAGCRWVNHAASSRNRRTIARSGAVTIRAAMRKADTVVSVAFRSLGGKLWLSPRGSRYPRLLQFSSVSLSLSFGLAVGFLLPALLCALGGVPRMVDAGCPFGLAALLGYFSL